MIDGDTECRIVTNRCELLSELGVCANIRMNPTCKLGLQDPGEGEL
jgi:hypothetical protein